uniref:Uncharacterized protein n=1 Tax=Arundo donax TaxID=35708 RepID=A0A0A9BBW8_ARUDO
MAQCSTTSIAKSTEVARGDHQ